MEFILTESQIKKVNDWYDSIRKDIAESQRKDLAELHDHLTMDGEYPYYGAIGGGLTYSFTPNGIGTTVKVKESITGKELDLTDYESW